MAEIATWSAILNKTGLGKTSNECPTKAELLALNNGKNSNVDKVIVISNAASYGNNECVKLEDINAEQWIYHLEWIKDPSFDAPATGGEFYCGVINSGRVKYVNGTVGTNNEEVILTKSSEGSWYTRGEFEGVCKRIVPNNTSLQNASTIVTWTQKYSGKTLQATFTRAAGSKVPSSWSYDCRVDKTSFSYSGGQANVTAKSANRTYTWNGIGDSYSESETATVTVTSPASISGNSITIPSNSDSARSFTVHFNFPSATDQNITISQEGGVVSYVDHLSISPTSKTVSGSGQTFSVTVDANFDKYINGVYQENISSRYSRATVVSGNSSDISISRTSYGCDITVDPNPSESSSRTYVVEFEYDSATPVRLNITQYSAEVSYPSGGYYLGQSRVSNSGFTTSNLQVTNGDNKGGSFTVYYKSYRTKYVNGSSAGIEPVTPNVSPKDLWVNTYIDPRPNSDNVYTVEVRYQANLNHSNRSTRITGSNGSAYDVYVDFTQDPADSYEFQIRKTTSDSWSTSITYDNWPGNDGVMDGPFIINSLKNGERFTNWGASSNVDWITIQDDGNTVRYTVATNNGSSSRTGVITFTQGESGKTCTLTVIQNAGISYRFSFNELGDQTESALSGDFSLQTKYIQVYSNNSQGKPVQFSLSGIVPSWVSLNIPTTNAIPEEVRIKFDENPTHANRSGTITLIQSKSGKTLTLKVSQAGRFYNLELLGSGVVYLWDDVIKPTDAISPNTKFATQCPILLKHQGSLTVNNSGLGSMGSQVGNGDRVNIYRHDGTWRFVTSFTLIQGDQAISW